MCPFPLTHSPQHCLRLLPGQLLLGLLPLLLLIGLLLLVVLVLVVLRVVLLIVLLVLGIVIGIQSIGVVLMIAMLITPAAAARQWTSSLGGMVLLAACIGGAAAVGGTTISGSISNMPTGPVIILTGVAIFVFSILFAPRRGVLMQRIRARGRVAGAEDVAGGSP